MFQKVEDFFAKEPHVNEDVYELREPLIAKNSEYDSLSLGNIVALSELSRVPVGVCHESKSR
jgi:hypothetical protein